MNKPSALVMFVAHPIVAMAIVVAIICTTFAATNDASWWPIAAGLWFATVLMSEAGLRRRTYLAWKSGWDGMQQPAGPKARRRPSRVKPWIGCAMLAMLGLLFAANSDQAEFRIALVWLLATCAIAALVALWHRKGKATTADPAQPLVKIAVRQPLIPVPSLKHAYLALPDHCRAVLGP